MVRYGGRLILYPKGPAACPAATSATLPKSLRSLSSEFILQHTKYVKLLCSACDLVATLLERVKRLRKRSGRRRRASRWTTKFFITILMIKATNNDHMLLIYHAIAYTNVSMI